MALRLARGNTESHISKQALCVRRFIPAAVLCAILLLAGSALADTDFTLTVEKGGSAPLAGKSVYLFSGAGSYLGQSRVTDSAGQAVFSLADGDYKFRVDTLGYQYWTPVQSVPGTLAFTFEILHQDVTITVQKTYQASTDSISGIPTYLFTVAGSYQGVSATTNSSGQAVFNVPAGSYKVRANWLNKQVCADPFNQMNSTITFQQGCAQVTFIHGGDGVSGVNTYVFSSSGTYLGISGQRLTLVDMNRGEGYRAIFGNGEKG